MATVHGYKGYLNGATPVKHEVIPDYYPSTATEPFQYRCIMLLNNGKKLYATAWTAKQSYKKVMSIYREIRAIERRFASW